MKASTKRRKTAPRRATAPETPARLTRARLARQFIASIFDNLRSLTTIDEELLSAFDRTIDAEVKRQRRSNDPQLDEMMIRQEIAYELGIAVGRRMTGGTR